MSANNEGKKPPTKEQNFFYPVSPSSMCGYLCNSTYLLKLCINHVIIQNIVDPRLSICTSEIMQWHPWATHQHQQPYRHGDETVPQIAASAPN